MVNHRAGNGGRVEGPGGKAPGTVINKTERNGLQQWDIERPRDHPES